MLIRLVFNNYKTSYQTTKKDTLILVNILYNSITINFHLLKGKPIVKWGRKVTDPSFWLGWLDYIDNNGG